VVVVVACCCSCVLLLLLKMNDGTPPMLLPPGQPNLLPRLMPEHSTNLDHTPPLTPTSESKIRPVWVRQRARSLGILGVLGVLGRLPAIGELVSIPYGPVWQQQRADLTEFSDFLRRRLHRPKRREEREAAKATAARVVVGSLFTLSSTLLLLLPPPLAAPHSLGLSHSLSRSRYLRRVLAAGGWWP